MNTTIKMNTTDTMYAGAGGTTAIENVVIGRESHDCAALYRSHLCRLRSHDGRVLRAVPGVDLPRLDVVRQLVFSAHVRAGRG